MSKVEWMLKPGETMSRQMRTERYGGNPQSGIAYGSDVPFVFIYSDPSKAVSHGYNSDGWSTDGSVFFYTGEGRFGDQALIRGNQAIVEHVANRKAIKVFVADGVVGKGSNEKIQRYVGDFLLDPVKPYFTRQDPDADGKMRMVFVFRLLPEGPVWIRDEDRSQVEAGPSEVVSVGLGAAELVEGESEPIALERASSGGVKREGSTSFTAIQREADLVKRFEQHLVEQGSKACRYRISFPGSSAPLFTDIADETKGVLYEAKGVSTREAVRMAIGQVLDYQRYVESVSTVSLLLPSAPAPDLIPLLEALSIGCVYEAAEGSFVTELEPGSGLQTP